MTEHNTETLTRYLFDELAPGEKKLVEDHIRECGACWDFLVSAKAIHNDLRVVRRRLKPAEGETCPDVSSVIALSNDLLDERAAQPLRVHLLRCRACIEEFLALERMRRRHVNLSLRVAPGLVHSLNPPADGEWKSFPVATLTEDEQEFVSAPFMVAQLLSDPNGTVARVALHFESPVLRTHDRDRWNRLQVRVVSDKTVEWNAMLLSRTDSSKRTIAVKSLASGSVILPVTFGAYSVDILKDDLSLGTCDFDVEIFTRDEARDAARWYLGQEEYERAKLIAGGMASEFSPSDDELEQISTTAEERRAAARAKARTESTKLQSY